MGDVRMLNDNIEVITYYALLIKNFVNESRGHVNPCWATGEFACLGEVPVCYSMKAP